MVKIKKLNYVYAIGRRKSASARARLFLGKGETTVNGVSIDKYFPGDVAQNLYMKPFKTVEATTKYYATLKVVGGGKNGQLDAVVHAISRALVKADKTNYKSAIKKAGLLTRDERIRERRKVNTGGKARRQKQSPKR